MYYVLQYESDSNLIGAFPQTESLDRNFKNNLLTYEDNWFDHYSTKILSFQYSLNKKAILTSVLSTSFLPYNCILVCEELKLLLKQIGSFNSEFKSYDVSLKYQNEFLKYNCIVGIKDNFALINFASSNLVLTNIVGQVRERLDINSELEYSQLLLTTNRAKVRFEDIQLNSLDEKSVFFLEAIRRFVFGGEVVEEILKKGFSGLNFSPLSQFTNTRQV